MRDRCAGKTSSRDRKCQNRRKTGTMIREGVDSELNPLDLHAAEEAVRLKERLGGDAEITVISMGPPQVQKAVKAAIAMDAGWRGRCSPTGGLPVPIPRDGQDTGFRRKQAGHFDLLLQESVPPTGKQDRSAWQEIPPKLVPTL